jgi:carboxylesterase
MRIKKKNIILSIIAILFLILLVSAYNQTGFLQASKIDSPDLKAWIYEQGKIKETNGFAHIGQTQTCWLLIHSYTATPLEVKPLAGNIKIELGDFVTALLLTGHGEVPSALEGKNLDIWYKEAEKQYNSAFRLCDEVNIVGSSLGANLALRLAQEHEVKNLYILNPFLGKPYEFYKIFPFKTRTNLFSGILNYKKKKGESKINSPEGQRAHVSYYNMPYTPIKESFPFIDETISNLSKIKNPTLIAYSENDEVAGSQSAQKIFDEISSQEKILLNYKDSNHILLLDYEREAVMRDIIVFELKNRL